MVRRFFTAKIDHRVRDGWIAMDAVGAAPKEQITGLERIQFERVVAVTEHGLEVSGFAYPNILLAGIAGHVGHAALRECVIYKPRTLHAAVGRIGRAIFVAEILSR
jgi:hypothetical protein